MNKRNYAIFILYFTLFMVEFSFPQSTNLEQKFNDRYKGIESVEVLSDSYASYNIINLDSFIVAKMNQYHIPGLAASIVKDGEVYWTGAFGFANIENSIEVTDSTLFMLASTSKTVTGVALMQLWEKGLFELDDDINNYLPFEVHNPFFPDSIITIRMLLTHSSSINDNWDEMFYFIGDSPIPLGQYLEDYLVPGGAYYHTINYNNFRPGTTWDYCNVAVALAAYLVEEISGSFSTYCQDSIFVPLNMYETSWFLAELDTTHIARPYIYSGGNYNPLSHYGYSDYPSGQLRTSTLQLSNFLAAFMQGGEINNIRILDSATISLMTTVQFSQIDATQGLIWYKLLLNSRWIWGHGGGDKGVGSAMFYSPAENVGVICLCNVNARAFLEVIVDVLFNYVVPVSVEDEISLPISYRLSQNYPNPFNPTTIIKYSIPKLSFVTIKIYDVLGSEVAALVNEEIPVGTYEINWNAVNLSSGVYFYQLKAGSYVETKKMLLLK
jgi:CubicO group peptidase (beta-lactamase class C family)